MVQMLYLPKDFMKSTKVFPLIGEFNSNLPRHMKHNLARKAPNHPLYGNNLTPLLTPLLEQLSILILDFNKRGMKRSDIAHWIVKAWWFKKKFKNEGNELEERTLLAIPHRLMQHIYIRTSCSSDHKFYMDSTNAVFTESLGTLKTSYIDVLQHSGTIEVDLILSTHFFTYLINIFIFGK
uniref:Uncharacterized protein n=1 Tax=Vespula pensylvanica TaxID=30213 RepID=A0A834N176_VESPE|nr:hypothetical protein H0235_017600 [Vespula pensylvanica]